MFEEGDIVFRYSRAQALADGVLVDAGERARKAGFRVPVALTEAVWNACIRWPKTEPAVQDESGRLWDVVFLAALAARRAARLGTDRVGFEMRVVPRGGRRARLVELVVHLGPSDTGEPVVTIMAPGED